MTKTAPAQGPAEGKPGNQKMANESRVGRRKDHKLTPWWLVVMLSVACLLGIIANLIVGANKFQLACLFFSSCKKSCCSLSACFCFIVQCTDFDDLQFGCCLLSSESPVAGSRAASLLVSWQLGATVRPTGIVICSQRSLLRSIHSKATADEQFAGFPRVSYQFECMGR